MHERTASGNCELQDFGSLRLEAGAFGRLQAAVLSWRLIGNFKARFFACFGAAGPWGYRTDRVLALCGSLEVVARRTIVVGGWPSNCRK